VNAGETVVAETFVSPIVVWLLTVDVTVGGFMVVETVGSW
jgi:hypothetical protein